MVSCHTEKNISTKKALEGKTAINFTFNKHGLYICVVKKSKKVAAHLNGEGPGCLSACRFRLSHWTAAPLQNTNNQNREVFAGQHLPWKGLCSWFPPPTLVIRFLESLVGQCSPRKPHLPIGSIRKVWQQEYIFTPSLLFLFKYGEREKPQMFFFRFSYFLSTWQALLLQAADIC